MSAPFSHRFTAAGWLVRECGSVWRRHCQAVPPGVQQLCVGACFRREYEA